MADKPDIKTLEATAPAVTPHVVETSPTVAPQVALTDDPDYAAFMAFKAQQVEAKEKEEKEEATLIGKYGEDYVTTTKLTNTNGQAMKAYWTKEAWENLTEDTTPDGKPTGTKGGHRKLVQTPPEVLALKNGKANG